MCSMHRRDRRSDNSASVAANLLTPPHPPPRATSAAPTAACALHIYARREYLPSLYCMCPPKLEVPVIPMDEDFMEPWWAGEDGFGWVAPPDPDYDSGEGDCIMHAR